jgi:uncharacterized protein
MKQLFARLLLITTALLSPLLYAQGEANLDVDSPSIAIIKKSLAARFATIKPLLASGTIGLTRDGQIAIANADNIHPTEKRQVEILVEEDNKDRTTLYREIARANGRADWEGELKRTFGERWINRAPQGWMVQDAKGMWVKKG